MVTNGAESSLVLEVKDKQDQDTIFLDLKASVHSKRSLSCEQRGYGFLKYQGRLCVTRKNGLQERILQKSHTYRYSSHPGSTKMYRDLREVHWWKTSRNIFLSSLSSAQIANK